jgi:hypothetical protein
MRLRSMPAGRTACAASAKSSRHRVEGFGASGRPMSYTVDFAGRRAGGCCRLRYAAGPQPNQRGDARVREPSPEIGRGGGLWQGWTSAATTASSSTATTQTVPLAFSSYVHEHAAIQAVGQGGRLSRALSREVKSLS